MKLLSLLWIMLVAACGGAGLYFAHDYCPPAFWLTAKAAPFVVGLFVVIYLTIEAVDRLLRK